MIKTGKKIFSVTLLIWMFLLLYYPPIFNINMLHIVAAVSYTYIYKNYRFYSKIGGFNKVAKGILLLSAPSIYTMAVCMGREGLALEFVGFMELLIEVIPSSFAIAIYMKKKGYKTEDYIRVLLIVGTLQGIISVLTFIFPDLQLMIINRAIMYGFDAEKYRSFANRRYFGLAYNLVTYVPVVQAFMAVIAMRYLAIKNKIYILMIPFLLFSAIINGRSSIVILIIGIMILFLEQIKRARADRMAKIICIAIILSAVCFIGIRSFEFISPRTFIWLSDGIKEIFLLFTKLDMRGSYFSTLLNWNEYLPRGVKFFFGIGELSIGGNSYGVSSDIGYINYLWLGGIVLFLLLHCFYFSILYLIRKVNNKTVRFSAVFLFLICIIFNIKMPVFLLNECSIMIVMTYIITAIL